MKTLMALIASLAFASTVNAGFVFVTSAPTVGLPGFTTVTFWIEAGAGESLRGFDATFTGALNQVHPAGVTTPFNNLNPFFGATDASADSQFLFNSFDVFSIGVEENTNLLKGAISGITHVDPSVANPTPFAQLSIPAGHVCSDLLTEFDLPCDQNIALDLSFDLGTNDPLPFTGNLWYSSVPEPSTALLALLGLTGVAARRRR